MGLIAMLPLVLFLVLGGLVLGSAVLGIRRSAFLPKGLPAACCPACRYSVDTTRPIERCAECGRDLRVAGVLSPELIVRYQGTTSQITGGVGLLCVILMLVAGLGTSAGIGALGSSDEVVVISGLVTAGLVLVGGVLAGFWLANRRKRLLQGSDTTHPQPPEQAET
ncbi:MAG: hypothetical protein AAF356_08415 [Planctomycetota bacterium]